MSEQTEKVPDCEIFNLDEAIEFKKRTALSSGKVWHWNGNAANSAAAKRLANQPPAQVAGEAMFHINANNTVAVWLFY